MQTGKAAKLRDWLQSWEGFEDYTKLNAVVEEPGESAVRIIGNDEVVSQYIDGTALRDYTFELLLSADWSDGNSTANETAAEWGERLHDWLTTEAGFPDWDVEFVRLTPLSNTATLAAVSEDQKTALYSFQARITYRE